MKYHPFFLAACFAEKHGWQVLLRSTLYAELRPPFGTPGIDNRATSGRFHSLAKTMGALTLHYGGLIGALHFITSKSCLAETRNLTIFQMLLSINIYPAGLWISPRKKHKMQLGLN